MQTFSPELFQLHGRDDNGSHFLTRDPRLTTTHYCSFQSGPLGGSALKNKHHCHKILRRNNWIKLTLRLKLCRKSAVLGILLTWSWVNGSRVLARDPRDPLRFVDPLDPWPTDPFPLSSLLRGPPPTDDELKYAATEETVRNLLVYRRDRYYLHCDQGGKHVEKEMYSRPSLFYVNGIKTVWTPLAGLTT